MMQASYYIWIYTRVTDVNLALGGGAKCFYHLSHLPGPLYILHLTVLVFTLGHLKSVVEFLQLKVLNSITSVNPI